MPARCPICSKPLDPAYRPFCSRRCADVDLQRWLVGRYAIPAAREEDGDDDEPDAAIDPHGPDVGAPDRESGDRGPGRS